MQSMTIPQRSSGILLHPTSLPGPFGIGDLGPDAYTWVDTLRRARQQWWQVLPLTPTGYADSPYQSLSAFAGNPNLISPELLVRDGLVRREDLPQGSFPDGYVDFDSGRVIGFKNQVLQTAWQNFQSGAGRALKPLFETFCEAESFWLDPFALYMALKEAHGMSSWLAWDEPYRLRQPAALEQARQQFGIRIQEHRFRQFLFARQWQALREYANAQGVRLIGDVPIFVSADSADVWGNPQFFLLDEQRRPLAVAGVPPDYFSKTGQLWGNPLYDWPALKASGYTWWAERLRNVLRQVDVVRIDHFRGFEANWAVPAGSPTAEPGHWVKGPEFDLFDALMAQLGEAPIIAEDLGVITPEVDALRTRYNFPGMRILQFAFSGAIERRFLPHNYETNTVVYTGTHDNDTTTGWYQQSTLQEREFMCQYMGTDGTDIAWEMMRLAWGSVAVLAVAPLQDVLSLGSEARMNLPGQPSGWWRWRFRKEQLTEELLERLQRMTEAFERAP
jgi:4-alpha-glucanotransferase